MAPKQFKVKPGKGQSKLAFVMGIIFCLIGLFVVVPIFGPFGLLWTGAAAAITVHHYRNAFTEEGSPTHVIEIEDGESFPEPNDAAAPQTADRTKTRLEAARRLYDEGVITREEYDRKREEILAQL